MSNGWAAKECIDSEKMPDIFENFYEVEAVVKIMVSDREDTINSSFGVGHNLKRQLRNGCELIHYNVTKQLNFIKTHYVCNAHLYLEKVFTNDEEYVYKKLITDDNKIEMIEVPFEKRADGDWYVSENWSGKILEIPTFDSEKSLSNRAYPAEIAYEENDSYDRGVPEIKI